MKTFNFIFFSFIFFTVVAQKKTTQHTENISTPSCYVNDFAHILSNSEVALLNESITAFDSSTSNQIAIVTINSTAPSSIEAYAKALFNKWGIGRKDKNNGVLLLVAYKDRKIRITTGTGIQTKLTDAKCKSIIDEILVPHFKANKKYAGIDGALAEIQTALRKAEKLNKEERYSRNSATVTNNSATFNSKVGNDNSGFILSLIIGAVVVLFYAAVNFFLEMQIGFLLQGE
jgi:uncharacterized membrane protein YgcG